MKGKMIKDLLYKINRKFKNFYKGLNLKPYYKRAPEFWVQKVPYKRKNNRLEFFISECKNRNVLHFGCTDWPIFNPNNNLHIQLSKITNSIDGFDIDKEGIQELKKYVDQDYYSDYKQLPNKKYDVCLIPETIEHVDNVAEFLVNISKINASKFYITAPNCFSKIRLKNYKIEKDHFFEVVHPDHNSWFSPYTLKNQIEKYSQLKVNMTYLLENETMVCCEATKK